MNVSAIEALLCASLAYLSYFLYVRRSSELPPIVYSYNSIPILGPAIALGADPFSFLQACSKRYGRVFSVLLPGITIIADGELGLYTEGYSV